MKSLFVAFVAGCWLTPVSAQWLETTLTLSDTSAPVAFCYNGVNDRMYCALRDIDSVAVIECSTNTVIAYIAVGDYPTGLCHNFLDNKVYCVNEGSNDVTIIDGSRNEVIETIDVMGTWPRALCWNFNDDKVYVANCGSGTVTVIDGQSNAIVAVKPSGDNPLRLSWNYVTNKVYSANYGSSFVTVIDGATNRVMGTIPVGSDPVALTDILEGGKVYCSSYLAGRVDVIYCDGDTVGATITCPTALQSCYNHADDKLYVIDSRDSSLCVIDGVGDTVLNWLHVFGDPVALYHVSDADKLFCAHYHDWGEGSVLVLDGRTDEVICEIPVGLLPAAIDYSYVWNRIYVANRGSGTISVIRDSVAGVEESQSAATSSLPIATVVRGVLLIGDGTRDTEHREELLDAAGRKVMELHAGANDVSGLTSGVYFVRQAQAQAQAVAKVVVQR